MAFQFLPVLATSLNIVSQGLSFFGARRQAAALRREGALMAEDAIARGNFAAEQYRRDLSGLLGRQRTSFAAQGLDVSFGTPAAIAEQTETIGQRDIQTIRENAMREAMALRRGFRNQAAALNAQSWGAAGSAFASLASLGANAWDAYTRNRTGRMKVNTLAAKVPTMTGPVYGPTYGPPTGY